MLQFRMDAWGKHYCKEAWNSLRQKKLCREEFCLLIKADKIWKQKTKQKREKKAQLSLESFLSTMPWDRVHGVINRHLSSMGFQGCFLPFFSCLNSRQWKLGLQKLHLLSHLLSFFPLNVLLEFKAGKIRKSLCVFVTAEILFFL